MITVKVEIAKDEDCWFVKHCDEVSLICWSDTEEDLRKQATEAIIFTLRERDIEPSQIVCNFHVVPFRESEVAY